MRKEELCYATSLKLPIIIYMFNVVTKEEGLVDKFISPFLQKNSEFRILRNSPVDNNDPLIIRPH